MVVSESWLWVSGVFFVLGSISFLVLVAILTALLKEVRELKPKIDKLVDTANTTAKDVGSTAHMIKGKTERILDTAAGAVEVTAGRLAMISTVLGVIVAAAKAKDAIKHFRGKREDDEKHPKDA